MKNNNNKAVGVTPGKNNLQLPTWLQCYLMSLTSVYISADLNLFCYSLWKWVVYIDVIQTGPRNVYIFYECSLKHTGLLTVVHVHYLEALLMPSSYS